MTCLNTVRFCCTMRNKNTDIADLIKEFDLEINEQKEFQGRIVTNKIVIEIF